MTRDQVKAVLARLETVRSMMANAAGEGRRRRLHERYDELSAEIAPYVEGRKKYSDADV